MQEIAIASIKIENRHRKKMGDIAALAASIEQIGLLQPIGIHPDHTLIFGHRRLLAFQHLGRTTIPATIINVPAIVLGEHAENEIRKDFTISERVAIGLAVEAELGKRQGQRTDLVSENQAIMFDELRQNFGEVETGKRTDEIAAGTAGFGNKETYRQAKAVQKATPELIDAVDKGEIAVSTAAKLATAPAEVQQQAAANPKAAIELAKKASAAKQADIKKQADAIQKREAQAEMEAVRALRPSSSDEAPTKPAAESRHDPVFDTVLPNGKPISEGDPRAKFLWGWLLELEDRFLNQAPPPEELAGNFLEFMEQDSARLIPRITAYLNHLLECFHAPVS